MRRVHLKIFLIYSSGDLFVECFQTIFCNYGSGHLEEHFSAVLNHLYNFEPVLCEEQFCEIILNLNQWFMRRCGLKILPT